MQLYTRRQWLTRLSASAGAALLSLCFAGCAGQSASNATVAPSAAAIVDTSDALPSWKDGAAKQTIRTFVADVTREGSSNFVPPAERIAVFDNDGTLWSEQ